MNFPLTFAAICGLASWAPVVILSYEQNRPRLALPPRRTSDEEEDKKRGDAKRKGLRGQAYNRRWNVPEQVWVGQGP